MIDLVVIIKIFELIGIDISNWLGIKYYWLCKYFFFWLKGLVVLNWINVVWDFYVIEGLVDLYIVDLCLYLEIEGKYW